MSDCPGKKCGSTDDGERRGFVATMENASATMELCVRPESSRGRPGFAPEVHA